VSPTSPGRTALVFDSLGTIPEFTAIAEAVETGNWSGTESALSDLPSDEALYALVMLAEREDAEAFVAAGVERGAGSDIAPTAYALSLVFAGWRIRGRSIEVSAADHAAFLDHLNRAETILIDVCAAPTPYPPAWGARVLTARALEVGLAEGRRRYARSGAAARHDFVVQQHMLQFLLPKWGGSFELAGEFARAAAADAPEGSVCGALIPLLHIEKWLAVEGGGAGRSHLRQAAVLSELRHAAGRSVLSPQHVPGPLSVQAHSAFAVSFWLAGEEADAAPHLRALGDRATSFPWEYAVSTPEEVAVIRDRVLAHTKGVGV
jgi:hypothetical protein